MLRSRSQTADRLTLTSVATLGASVPDTILIEFAVVIEPTAIFRGAVKVKDFAIFQVKRQEPLQDL